MVDIMLKIICLHIYLFGRFDISLWQKYPDEDGRNILMKIYPYGRFDHVEDVSIFTTFIINCNKNSDFGYTLIVYVDYPEYLRPLHNNLLFLHQKILINKEKKKLSGSDQIILT